jgi:hypothetical protein
MKIRIQYTIMVAAWFGFFFALTVARQPWLAACAVAVFVVTSLNVSRAFNSDINLVVGQSEKHKVNFLRNQMTGKVRITVDGVVQLKKIEIVSSLTSRYQLSLGTAEHHDITFVKSRPRVFAPWRTQPIQVLVDGTATTPF